MSVRYVSDVLSVSETSIPCAFSYLEMKDFALDTRFLQQGDVFIARQGDTCHGMQFALQAERQGAVAIICDQALDNPTALPMWVCPDLDQKLSLWLGARYPKVNALPKVAVTGTNGKSSVSQFIAQALFELNKTPVGLLGTLGNGVWPELVESPNTTVDITQLYRILGGLQRDNVSACAMEVSSHGLSLNRVDGLTFDIGVFTNLSQDHLDFHRDMEDYYQAKKALFTGARCLCAVINIDDVYGQRLFDELTQEQPDVTLISYGASEAADVRYFNIHTQCGGLCAHLRTPWGEGELSLPLLGTFNVANVAAMVACVCLLQKEKDVHKVLSVCSSLVAVDGRMSVYTKKDAPTVVVDFAHTPDALAIVQQALKPSARALVTVFGCGGDRDRSKRAKMADAVLAHADCAWLTDDNPRTEDPDQIWRDVLSAKGSESFRLEHQRKRAIEQAVEFADEADIVLVAGKGHERYQHIGHEKTPYSDEDVLLALGYQALAGGRHAVK